MDGKAVLVDTMLLPPEGETAHAREHRSSVALEPTQTSATSQESSLAAALRRGIIPFFSASPPNSAAPPRARASDHFMEALCAAGEVVATLA